MPRRLLRFIFTALSALSLLLCAVLVAMWVQSYRQRYVLGHGRVGEQATVWVLSERVVSLEPSCVYVWRQTDPPYSKEDVLPGPFGDVRILVRDRPPDGWHWEVAPPAPAWDSALVRQDVRWEFLRFARAAADFPNYAGASYRLTIIPLYAVALLTTAPPVVWLRGRLLLRRAARRAAAGLCPKCGYDLRASPGRCPECGAEPLAADKPPHARRPGALPAWTDWIQAAAWVALTTGLLGAALLPLSSVLPGSSRVAPAPSAPPTPQP